MPTHSLPTVKEIKQSIPNIQETSLGFTAPCGKHHLILFFPKDLGNKNSKDEYFIIEKNAFAAGSIGKVYQAYKIKDLRTLQIETPKPSHIKKYAIKFIEKNACTAQEVKNEVVALQSLDEHARLPPASEYFHYIIGSLVSGFDLTDSFNCLSAGILELDIIQRFHLIMLLFSKLVIIHHGIMGGPFAHGDIRGVNLKFSYDKLSDTFKIYLIDFGNAKKMKHAQCLPIKLNQITGSPLFLDPQMIKHQLIHFKSDIFSLLPLILLILNAKDPFIHKIKGIDRLQKTFEEGRQKKDREIPTTPEARKKEIIQWTKQYFEDMGIDVSDICGNPLVSTAMYEIYFPYSMDGLFTKIEGPKILNEHQTYIRSFLTRMEAAEFCYRPNSEEGVQFFNILLRFYSNYPYQAIAVFTEAELPKVFDPNVLYLIAKITQGEERLILKLKDQEITLNPSQVATVKSLLDPEKTKRNSAQLAKLIAYECDPKLKHDHALLAILASGLWQDTWGPAWLVLSEPDIDEAILLLERHHFLNLDKNIASLDYKPKPSLGKNILAVLAHLKPSGQCLFAENIIHCLKQNPPEIKRLDTITQDYMKNISVTRQEFKEWIYRHRTGVIIKFNHTELMVIHRIQLADSDFERFLMIKKYVAECKEGMLSFKLCKPIEEKISLFSQKISFPKI